MPGSACRITSGAGTSTAAEYNYDGKMRDANGLDPIAMRAYASALGRWLTPDPAGLGAVDPNDPQTWNRYACTLNDPASLLDSLGLSPITFQTWVFGNTRDNSMLAGNLTESPPGGAFVSETSRPLQLNPVLSSILGALMADPVLLGLQLAVCN